MRRMNMQSQVGRSTRFTTLRDQQEISLFWRECRPTLGLRVPEGEGAIPALPISEWGPNRPKPAPHFEMEDELDSMVSWEFVQPHNIYKGKKGLNQTRRYEGKKVKNACEECENTFRFKTVCPNKRLRKRLTKFDCEAETGQCTIWDDKAGAPRDKRYFEVFKIPSHRDRPRNGRHFELFWAGYFKKSTWDNENNFNGCVEMLKTYCKKHVITTHVQPRVGAGHRSEEVAFYNKDNWVDCGDLASFVENYRKITNGYDKTVEIATNPQDTNEKEDTLVVFEFEYQAFVASKPRNQDNVYIADGTNELDKNPKTLEFMKNLFAPRILVTVKLGDQ